MESEHTDWRLPYYVAVQHEQFLIHNKYEMVVEVGGYIFKDNITHPRDISAVYHKKKIILSQFSRVLTMVIRNTLTIK